MPYVAFIAPPDQIKYDRTGGTTWNGRNRTVVARTRNMIELRLPRALVTAATVSLVVLVAQWLPVSASGGVP
jgi:hypothetical protein